MRLCTVEMSSNIQQLLLVLSHITYLCQTLLVVCEKQSCFDKEKKIPLENNYHFLRAKCQVRLGVRIKKRTCNDSIVFFIFWGIKVVNICLRSSNTTSWVWMLLIIITVNITPSLFLILSPLIMLYVNKNENTLHMHSYYKISHACKEYTSISILELSTANFSGHKCIKKNGSLHIYLRLFQPGWLKDTIESFEDIVGYSLGSERPKMRASSTSHKSKASMSLWHSKPYIANFDMVENLSYSVTYSFGDWFQFNISITTIFEEI